MSVAFRSSKRRRRLMVLLKDWSLIIVMCFKTNYDQIKGLVV